MHRETEAADLRSGCAHCNYLLWVCFDHSVFAVEAEMLAEPAYMHTSFQLRMNVT